MAKVDIKVISRENIKPSSPTPQHLKTFKLSVFDQLSPTYVYTSLILFYPLFDHDYHRKDCRIPDLKSSLSETLTRFYPLAGRIIETESVIDCTDAGAEFIEAKVSGRLSDILKHPDPNFISELFATNPLSMQNAAAGSILLVQANLFECGGLAIGVSISHKLADASTLSLFIKGWAAQARGTGDIIAPDMTTLASRFLSVHLPVGSEPAYMKELVDNVKIPCKTIRFVFDSKSINALKAKATSGSVQRPTRVEVVTAHIWKSMNKLSSRDTKIRSYALIQPMNLRKRVDPPLSANSLGNLLGNSIALVHKTNEKAIELEDMIGNMRTGLQNATKNYREKMSRQEALSAICEVGKEIDILVRRDDVEMVIISSWCGFGFYENGDFGWGKPGWVSHVKCDVGDVVLLMDTQDGDGVEAFVTLEEPDMDLLEIDPDFLEFAVLNLGVGLY